MSLLQSRISWPLVGVLAAAVILLLALFLLGKVPLSYNLRNLTVRWKTTVMTALAFTHGYMSNDLAAVADPLRTLALAARDGESVAFTQLYERTRDQATRSRPAGILDLDIDSKGAHFVEHGNTRGSE